MLEDAISALNTVMKLPGLPKTLQDLHCSAMLLKTSRKSPNPLNECVGALDGLAVKIKSRERMETLPFTIARRISTRYAFRRWWIRTILFYLTNADVSDPRTTLWQMLLRL